VLTKFPPGKVFRVDGRVPGTGHLTLASPQDGINHAFDDLVMVLAEVVEDRSDETSGERGGRRVGVALRSRDKRGTRFHESDPFGFGGLRCFVPGSSPVGDASKIKYLAVFH
jgi:hypothetical protein